MVSIRLSQRSPNPNEPKMIINVIKPQAYILTWTDDAEAFLERCGRTCYKSEGRITEASADRFVRMICRNRHESVLEHASMTVRIVCSRACSHQLVRHRLGAYSQESQRYVNYSKRGYEVICPPSFGLMPGEYETIDGDVVIEDDITPIQLEFLAGMSAAFTSYENALRAKVKPEDARYFLPNAAKTELIVTYNFRQWRHVFRERALNPHAQWEIRSIMESLFTFAKTCWPSVFEDLEQ